MRELFQGLSEEQRRQVVLPWNHGGENNATPTRKRMYNAPIFANRNIGAVYTRAQQELNQRIIRSICSDDEGYRRISRNGTWDGSHSFNGCGAYIFGDPSGNQPYAWVFTGHHLTVRCDGNSEPDAAFGGPMYYGHSPDGYSQRNIFNYQTRSVLSVFDALNEQQRRQAVMATYPQPRELEGSIRFRRRASASRHRRPRLDRRPAPPGRTVMRDLLSPYRREDADEVMELLRRNGGLDRLHLAFYRDAQHRRRPLGLLAPRRPRLRVELPRPAARSHLCEYRSASPGSGRRAARVNNPPNPRRSQRFLGLCFGAARNAFLH